MGRRWQVTNGEPQPMPKSAREGRPPSAVARSPIAFLLPPTRTKRMPITCSVTAQYQRVGASSTELLVAPSKALPNVRSNVYPRSTASIHDQSNERDIDSDEALLMGCWLLELFSAGSEDLDDGARLTMALASPRRRLSINTARKPPSACFL